MKNEIIKAISESDAALSAKAIAAALNMDAPSEVLRDIEQEGWEMVEAGTLIAFDLRGQKNGALFFDVA